MLLYIYFFADDSRMMNILNSQPNICKASAETGCVSLLSYARYYEYYLNGISLKKEDFRISGAIIIGYGLDCLKMRTF